VKDGSSRAVGTAAWVVGRPRDPPALACADRKGVWSLNVTRNWRLTFRIEDGGILDVDYEDYH
jgi:hypothetical protein